MKQFPFAAYCQFACPSTREDLLIDAIPSVRAPVSSCESDHNEFRLVRPFQNRTPGCDSDHNFSPVKSIGYRVNSDLQGLWVCPYSLNRERREDSRYMIEWMPGPEIELCCKRPGRHDECRQTNNG